MTYCELKDLSEIKGVTLRSLADEVNMTRTGFRSSIENQTLPISKVEALCKKIGISPNDFFSWKSNTAPQQIQTSQSERSCLVNRLIGCLNLAIIIKFCRCDYIGFLACHRPSPYRQVIFVGIWVRLGFDRTTA